MINEAKRLPEPLPRRGNLRVIQGDTMESGGIRKALRQLSAVKTDRLPERTPVVWPDSNRRPSDD